MQAQDTSWAVAYNPSVGGLPDAATPRWKRIGVGYGGSYSTSSQGLSMSVDHSASPHDTDDDMFFFRSDNLYRTEKAYVQANIKLLRAGGKGPAFILALADSTKFVGLGIGNGKIGMVTFDQDELQWEWVGTTLDQNTTGAHTYRVGKFGADSSTVYVDGAAVKLSMTNSKLPNNFLPTYSSIVGGQAAHLSVFFGPTAQDADTDALVTSMNYAFHATPKP
jgi:hypothetical protein